MAIRKQHKDATDKYDPAEILVDDKEDEVAASSQVAAPSLSKVSSQVAAPSLLTVSSQVTAPTLVSVASLVATPSQLGSPSRMVTTTQITTTTTTKVCYYDDNSTSENDSDTEYMKEAKERNLKNLRNKTQKIVPTTEDRQNESSTDSDYSDDQYDSNHEAYENMSFKRGRNGQKSKRKSRWDHSDTNSALSKVPSSVGSTGHQLLRNDPAFLQFVYSNFGTLEVSDEKWKNAESHFHIKQLYETMAKNIQDHERFLTSIVTGKFDSEEERLIDSNKVKSIMIWVNELTKLHDAQGNKSLKEFLLPLEMQTFRERFVSKNREPDFEDYKKYKLEQAKFMSTNRNLARVAEKVKKNQGF